MWARPERDVHAYETPVIGSKDDGQETSRILAAAHCHGMRDRLDMHA
jgi:hypothetical protein